MTFLLAAEESARTLPASPAAFGLITFAFLSACLWFVLQWNKDR